MSFLGGALIILSALLSTGRNIMSKGISDFKFATKKFYFSQFVLFFSGSIIALIFGNVDFSGVAPETLLYSVIYGILLIFTQWFYTASLTYGNVSICATLYSLGFIFPTLSGFFFWNETLNFFNAVGIICIVFAMIISSYDKKDKNSVNVKNGYIVPLMVAVLSTGGLGIMQKLQQKSQFAHQKAVFVFVAFIIAGLVSLLFFLFKKNNSEKYSDKKLFMSAGIGLCFGGCNLLNTTLAGMLKSNVFFPTYNITVIFLSILSGIIIFKEKLTKKNTVVFILGILAILLLNVK